MNPEVNAAHSERQGEQAEECRCYGQRLFEVRREWHFVGNLKKMSDKEKKDLHPKTNVDGARVPVGELAVFEGEGGTTGRVQVCRRRADPIRDGREGRGEFNISGEVWMVSSAVGPKLAQRLTLLLRAAQCSARPHPLRHQESTS